ncbi:MAG: hypothetical protein Q8O26_11200 [Phreatobacter sp.]|uniref:hypothetical protein n=1 Tax=Phreatobacter sp. TaxID=1966341 RepID=UPI002735B8BE|nr:hypothetical protein [Phreatobacter sp.]MDP2802441.1 hypothetical protein [Phreatobacter sp.]
MKPSSTPQPDPAIIRDALRRITASTLVPTGSVPATILTHVVERTLAGDDRTIKAYTIAVEGLGRSPDFNPDRDSTVRVAAMRLRNALDLYYAGPGARDPLRIRMAPGSYRPTFEPVAVEAEPGISAEPALPAVAPRSRRVAFSTSANWLIAISAILAMDLAMTVSLMAVQMRSDMAPYAAEVKPAYKRVRAAAKAPAGDPMLDQIHYQVQRSYRQVVD